MSDEFKEFIKKADFEAFLERLKKSPDFVKENVMCYFYYNSSACRGCGKTNCKERRSKDSL